MKAISLTLRALFVLAALAAVFSFPSWRAYWHRMNTPGVTIQLFPEVEEATRCLNRLGVKAFRLVGDFKENEFLYQRFVEVNWPIVTMDTAATFVARASATLPCPSPEILCEGKEVRVGRCFL